MMTSERARFGQRSFVLFVVLLAHVWLGVVF